MNTARILVRLARILVDYRGRREVVRPPPIRLWVETASVCNLRCAMCPNKDMQPGDRGLMKIDLFRAIVDQARRFANDLYLHHRGEPFLNPALFDMIATARDAGLRTRFHTNGTVMDRGRADRLLDARPDLVSFSVDGFEKESYEAIRAGAVFEKTVDNILYLAGQRRERRLRAPYLVVEKIRFRDPARTGNTAATAALKRRFLQAGIDEVIEKDEYVWAEERAPAPDGPRTCRFCTFPWYAMVICADGTVTPCPQDFWAKMNMGNAAAQPLLDIWNGPAYRALRAAFRADLDSLPLCRKCDRLHRRTVGGIPLQYMATFLIDQVLGYGRLRRSLGTAERS